MSSASSPTIRLISSNILGLLVFKIPPLKKNEGHRAQEWGDLGNPLWKGRLRIIERSNSVAIQFEDATTGEASRVTSLPRN